MAEAIVVNLAKSVVSTNAYFVGDVVTEQLKSFKSVKDDLKDIKRDLEYISAVLEDASAKRYSHAGMTIWIRDLKSIVYDIDDVLDEVAPDALQREVNKGYFFTELVYYLSFQPLVSRFDLSQKINKLQQQLNQILAKRDKFGLKDHPIETPNDERYLVAMCSYVNPAFILGRDEAKNDILNRISGLRDSFPLFVLPIVGMGGIGKTVFAKLVYGAVDQFDIKVWECVSNKFDIRKTINNTLKNATYDENTSSYPFEKLVKKVRKVLNGKKFFLVLDDLWEDDNRLWTELKSILGVGTRGSVILITTRAEIVARTEYIVEPFYLESLPDSTCLCIFNEFAFADGEAEKYPKLCQIGLSIVGKCCGNPLAVRALGIRLRNERKEKEWLRIKNMDNLNQLDGQYRGVKQLLKLSFDKLSSELKSGFAHLSLFPKDNVYLTYYTSYCWSALGLSHLCDGDKSYFYQKVINKLLSRSMLQDVEWDFDETIIKFKINFLLHDIAVDVLEDELAVVTMNQLNVSESSRYLIWDSSDLANIKFPEQVKVKNTRVFMFRQPTIGVSKLFVKGIISSMPRLRILGLGSIQFEELPSTIGNLKHLRVLDLSNNGLIKSLPETVCELVNLECIILAGCCLLEELPLSIYKLIKLSFLFLTSRQKSLAGFNRLRYSLRHMLLVSCSRLESLWDNEDAGSLISLRSLGIEKCRRLKRLPDSMKLLVNLEHLSIVDCEELDLESGIGLRGLQKLQALAIRGVKSTTCLPNDLRSAVRSLKYMLIEDCKNLAELPDWLETCTSLRTFYIHNCRNLLYVPHGIGLLNSFQRLEIGNCPHLSQRFAKPGRQDLTLIQHVPEIWLDSHQHTSYIQQCTLCSFLELTSTLLHSYVWLPVRSIAHLLSK